MNVHVRDQFQDGFHVDTGRFQQVIGQRFAFQFGRQRVAAANFDNFTHQRVTVGVWAAGTQGNQHIAVGHFAAVNDLGFLDNAHAETGYVVIFAVVHPRHFSGFTANQRTARLQAAFSDTADHAGCGVHVQLAGRVVVEEEQRLSTLNHQVVNTHGNQINTDGVVAFQIHRQTQLGAYAVGARDQNRFTVFLRQRAQGAESSQPTHYFRAAGFFNYPFDTVNQRITCVNIYTGIFVAERSFVGHGSSPHAIALRL